METIEERGTVAPHQPAAQDVQPRLSLAEIERELYEIWKRDGQHFEEYVCEFLGTAILMFGIVGFVALMFAPSSPVPHLIPFPYARLFLAGLCIGTTGGLVAISPLGRLSGAHINPSVSLGFWLLGKMHGKDMLGYVVAQMLGAVLGAFAAKGALTVAATQVNQAVLGPGPGIGVPVCFAAEFAATVALCWVIFYCVSVPKLMHYTPIFVAISAGVLVMADGHVSGAGMNPARWFGPAVDTNTWALWWLYSIGPLVAGLLAAWLRKVTASPHHAMPSTAKLFHDGRYRSIFKHDKAHSTPPTLPNATRI